MSYEQDVIQLEKFRTLKQATKGEIIDLLKHEPHWVDVWRYDELKDKVVAVNPPIRLDAETKGFTRADAFAIACWMEAFPVRFMLRKGKDKEPQEETGGLKSDITSILDAVHTVALSFPFHPVREYLQGLPPPTTKHLDQLATLAFGAQTELENIFLRKTLIGAVRRTLKPGTKMDTMLVLHGLQGLPKKSTSLSVLFHEKWFKDDMPDLTNQRDAAAACAGFWCIEMSELKQILRADAKVFKSFISRSVDVYTPKYEKNQLEVPRQCIFVGTTNDDDFLRDPTGSRRFWPVKCVTSGADFLKAHRDEIWSEAYALAISGEPHWLEKEDAAEEWRNQFEQTDEWEEPIRDYCQDKEYVRVVDVWRALKGGFPGMSAPISDLSRAEEQRIRDVLRRMKMCRTQTRVDGKQTKVWKHTT